MNRILLVNPWIHDFAAYDLWMKPLGLLYLASLMRQNGCKIDFIDCLDPHHPGLESAPSVKRPKRASSGKGHFPKEALPKPDILRQIKRRYYRFGISPEIFRDELSRRESPDLIMVTSMMTYWYPGVVETIRILCQAFPGAPVILGGVYATLCREHALQFSGADEVVAGNGIKRLPGLMRKYLNRDFAIEDPGSLDELPYPAFDLIQPIEQIPLMVSRGCPYHCAYCASGLLNTDGFQTRNPLRVVDEIQFWHDRHGVRHFAFYDDALLVNSASSLIPILKELVRRNLDCSFHCPNGLHLREVTGELAGLMRNTGFKTLRFGFETSDIQRQLETGGKTTSDHLRRAIASLREAGYAPDEIGVYVLCGLPGQSSLEIERSIRFVQSCGARPILTEYSPLPGTALWPQAVSGSPWDIIGEPLYHNNTLLPCRDQSLTDEVYHALKAMTRLAVG